MHEIIKVTPLTAFTQGKQFERHIGSNNTVFCIQSYKKPQSKFTYVRKGEKISTAQINRFRRLSEIESVDWNLLSDERIEKVHDAIKDLINNYTHKKESEQQV